MIVSVTALERRVRSYNNLYLSAPKVLNCPNHCLFMPRALVALNGFIFPTSAAGSKIKKNTKKYTNLV